MPRDPRTYITVHDGMPEHHKIEALSDKAFRCLIDLWCWCSRNLSDGLVPDATWLKRTNARVRAELLRDMVETADGGVRMRDYLEHQRSKAEVLELREKRSRAGSLGGRRSAETRSREAKGQAGA